MDHDETPEIRPKINAIKLHNLLRSPPEEFLIDKGNTIYIEEYDIEDDYIILDDSLKIEKNIKFERCSFKCQKSCGIAGMICQGNVTFNNCQFPSGITILKGEFKKELSFKYIESESVLISGGEFEKIHISGHKIKEIDIYGGQFNLFDVGGFPEYGKIEKLSINNRGQKLGNFNVSKQNFDELHIGGSNEGNSYDFKDIKSNIVSISNFNNEGSLNFYGMEPKDPKDELRYFQITNSNLGKAQFFQTNFSKYKEMIIVDSFITDSLFISCNWSKNIRALRGPGFNTFEDSLKTGRILKDKEIPKIQEAYRQLKISMSKQSDKIQESKFYAEELNYYNRSLKWTWPCFDQFWDKLILCLSNGLSYYGQSFMRPLFWLLFGHMILFAIPLSGGVFEPLGFSSIHNASWEAFFIALEKYFLYINPFRSYDSSLPGIYILVDMVMRIWSSYMIYNIIRASRRFIT